jgi:1-deoxy-D-xylulose-5-phosphate synthase
MTIMAPKDKYELIEMLKFSKDFDQPLAIRYPRGKAEKINEDVGDLLTPEILTQGDQYAVIAVGKMIPYAQAAIERIKKERNIAIRLINPRVLKPLHQEKMLAVLNNIEKIITIEDNVTIGGYGSYLNQQFGNQFDILNIGIEDRFIEQGDTAKLFEINGLNSEGLYKKIIDFLL